MERTILYILLRQSGLVDFSQTFDECPNRRLRRGRTVWVELLVEKILTEVERKFPPRPERNSILVTSTSNNRAIPLLKRTKIVRRRLWHQTCLDSSAVVSAPFPQ